MSVWISLPEFYATAAEDVRMSVTHVSLYLAMVSKWQTEAFPSELIIERKELMRLAKISSRTTYIKCLHDLHEFGYVRYNGMQGGRESKVAFKKL